jgi:hypothetical protein
VRSLLGASSYLAGTVGSAQADDEVQRLVDAGRDACRGDNVAVIDQPLIATNVDGGVQLGEQIQRRPCVVAGRCASSLAAAYTSEPVPTLVISGTSLHSPATGCAQTHFTVAATTAER